MGYCPKELKPCLDDLCYGSGCLLLQGVEMLERCDLCGALTSSQEACECAYEQGEDEEDWADEGE